MLKTKNKLFITPCAAQAGYDLFQSNAFRSQSRREKARLFSHYARHTKHDKRHAFSLCV